MLASLCAAIPKSGISPLPKYIFLLRDFKSLVEAELRNTEIAKRFKPRLYSYVDFIIPILYALTSNLSLEQACQELNNFFIETVKREFNLEPKVFNDGIRKRRLVPHQTKVDEFLRRFSEKEVQQVFGNILAQINEYIRKEEIKTSKVKFIADNTKYPYYGSMKTNTEIGSTKLPGTKYCRMIQGHSIYGAKLHLFTYFGTIRKGTYRAAPIFGELNWLRWLGYKISYALVDREFYRVGLVRVFKRMQIPFLMPSKKFQHIRDEMKEFIRNKRDLVDNYLFTQGSNQYPNQMSARISLAFVGHGNNSADDVKEKYYSSTMSLDKAVDELAGFFTTIKLWTNLKSFCRFLSRLYKLRWNIETGFRCLNSMHENFRNRSSEKQLAQIYVKALIYNNWQFWRKRVLKDSVSFSEGSESLFLRRYSESLVMLYRDIIYDRLKMVLKNKKEVYFK